VSMIVIVQYARQQGLLLGIDRFTDAQSDEACDRLHELIKPNTDDNVEIVMLSADSEEVLTKTHAKYFSGKAMRNLRREIDQINI
jgi:hypothetical protein